MLSRRTALAAGFAAPFAVGVPVALADSATAQTPSATPPPAPAIKPRSAWATKHPPRGALAAEDDVRFLIVHHTLTPNTDLTSDAVAARLRSIYAFHTGTRGWNDVAYNFFVDAAGGIWEGRQGSIAGPVRGDATGGSQGYAQLACFVGDFSAEVPSPAAMDAMVRLLAWMAGRSSLPLTDQVTFTSKGSSRWRKGVEVTTARIAGHRDMSTTECPGDALYPLVAGDLLPRAGALLVPPTPTPAPTPSPSASATPGASGEPTPGASGAPGDDLGLLMGGVAGVVGVAAVGGVAALWVRSAKQKREGDPPDDEGGDEADPEADGGR